jgi:hypothetical protein
MKCDKCGAELPEYTCSRTDEAKPIPHRPRECITFLAAQLAAVVKERDEAVLRWNIVKSRVDSKDGWSRTVARAAMYDAAMKERDEARGHNWKMNELELVDLAISHPKAEQELRYHKERAATFHEQYMRFSKDFDTQYARAERYREALEAIRDQRYAGLTIDFAASALASRPDEDK